MTLRHQELTVFQDLYRSKQQRQRETDRQTDKERKNIILRLFIAAPNRNTIQVPVIGVRPAGNEATSLVVSNRN